MKPRRAILFGLTFSFGLLSGVGTAHGQESDYSRVIEPNWERTTNYRVAPSYTHRFLTHGLVPRYYEDDSFGWDFTADQSEVWNRHAASVGIDWFYTPDHSGNRGGSCGMWGTQYWFRTAVAPVPGAILVGVRLTDAKRPGRFGVNEGAWLFINGEYVQEAVAVGLPGSAQALDPSYARRWSVRDLEVGAIDAISPAGDNEIALAFEEVCGWGGITRLALDLRYCYDADGDGVCDMTTSAAKRTTVSLSARVKALKQANEPR